MIEIKLHKGRVLIIFVCISLALGLQSCMKPELFISDGGLISKAPCGPPCFWGITPGKNTEAEVVQVFEEKKLTNQCKRFNSENESGTRGINCGLKISVGLKKGTELVECVGFRPDNLTLGEVVSTYGDPDAVLVLSGGTSQEHPPFTVMSIYYDRIQARLNLIDQEGDIYSANNFTLISDVSYFDTPSYESIRVVPIQKWKGYVDYQPNNK